MTGPILAAEELRQEAAGPRLEARDLRIEKHDGGTTTTIVSGINLSVAAGETIGIVGESGSGKSMVARALMRLLPPGVSAEGEIRYRSTSVLEASQREMLQLRGAQLGMVLQDPFTMLSPLRKCGSHVDELLRVDGARLSKRARRAEAVRRLAEVGITDPAVAERYPFQLSGGMRQRVGIAAALARDPDILIADEPTTALDVTTQKEILTLIKSLQESRRMGLVLITHDLRVAFSMCDRIYVLYAGTLLEVAPAARLEEEPLHPYSLGLLLSEPPVDRRVPALVAIGGSAPAHDEVAASCAFAPRCSWARPECSAGRPPLEPVGRGRLSACLRIAEIREDLMSRRTAQLGAHVEIAPSQSAALVKVEDLRKTYDVRGRRGSGHAEALRGVSLEVGAEESVGLVGESGSGKTTLARCLVGLESPSGGRIAIDGMSATDYGALTDADRRRLRGSVQMIFQDPYSTLNPVRTVGSTLKEAIAVRTGRSTRLDAEVGELLERVGLPAAYAARKPVALSGGERQRVAIARALAVRPKVIVCDEPVSALDVSVQAQILNLFKSLREDFPVSFLFITHDLAVVRQVVERIYVLYKGEIVETGAVDDVLDRPKHPYTARLIESVPRLERA